MGYYYDKQGDPLDASLWSALFGDMEYRRVAETRFSDGVWASTVWLGLNHNWLGGPPLIFETMVFDPELSDFTDLLCRRYPTEAAALEGHAAIVSEIMEMRHAIDRAVEVVEEAQS